MFNIQTFFLFPTECMDNLLNNVYYAFNIAAKLVMFREYRICTQVMCKHYVILDKGLEHS